MVFKQEKLIERFFLVKTVAEYIDIKVQIIGCCNPNDKERRYFWINHVKTIFPKGLNHKIAPRCN